MYFEQFQLEQTYAVSATITRRQIIEFSERYDPLPIHLDEDYAKTTRFGGLIASGVLSFMTLWTEFVRSYDLFGDDLVAGMDNHMAWSLPVYPNDTLSGVVAVTGLTERGRHNGVVEFTLTAVNQHGESVMTGGAHVLIRRQP